jgi:hypothetical protein
MLPGIAAFIQKPFSLSELGEKIRETLSMELAPSA